MTDLQRSPHQASLFDGAPSNTSAATRILVVASGEELYSWLAAEPLPGCQLSPASSGARALTALASEHFQILIMDGALPDLDSGELARMILSSFPHLSVLTRPALDGQGSFQMMRQLHPQAQLIADVLELRGQRVLQPQAQHDGPIEAVAGSRATTPAVELLPQVIGGSPSMGLVSRLVRLVAGRASTVLISGETGTGKERIARAIHDLSPRSRNPFVVVNCGAIPETLFEAELFGFERGAFTGAQQARIGKIQAARGGTLFLDEIGELPLAMQAKLLRFLQEREVQRLGSTESTRVDVRIIAATNADLKRLCSTGAFRNDLYYRLNVFPIALPPLRQRREDIALLARHFLSKFCRESSCPAKKLSAQAIEALKSYAWPGNVRELEHVIERAFIFSETSDEVHVELPAVDHCAEPAVNDAAAPDADAHAAHSRLPVARLGQLDPARELPSRPNRSRAGVQ